MNTASPRVREPRMIDGWEIVDEGDESASDGAHHDDEHRMSRPLPSDPSREMNRMRRLEGMAEAIVEGVVERAGGGDEREGNVNHQHFYRKRYYVFTDNSRHTHINHVHHHHYHQHTSYPFVYYNGFNGNGNVNSLQLNPYGRGPRHLTETWQGW